MERELSASLLTGDTKNAILGVAAELFEGLKDKKYEIFSFLGLKVLDGTAGKDFYDPYNLSGLSLTFGTNWSERR